MKIAFITFEYPPFIIGGAGVYAENISKELAKLGNDMFVFTPSIQALNEKNSDNRIKILRVSINAILPFKALQFWLKLPSIIKKEEQIKQFDMVLINGISYWFLPNKLSKAPHIGTVHHLVKDAYNKNRLNHIIGLLDISGENSLVLRVIEKRYLSSIDRIIAVSKYTKDKIIYYYDIDPKKIDVIYNGITITNNIFSIEEISLYRKQLSLLDRPIVLFVGRIDDPRKGLTFLLTAFKQVLLYLDATLLIVGSGNQSKLRNFANKLGIMSNIHFTGYVNEIDLKKIYQLCDVYVIPSRLEGFGLTILEAMSAGKPIVATNVGAIPELLKNNENGILVEPDDIQGMAEAIIKFISDVNYSQKIGNINKVHLTNEFKWDYSAKQVEHLFKKVTGIK